MIDWANTRCGIQEKYWCNSWHDAQGSSGHARFVIFRKLVTAKTGKKYFTFVYGPGDPKDPDTYYFPVESPYCKMDKYGAEMCAMSYLADQTIQFHESAIRAAQKFINGETSHFFDKPKREGQKGKAQPTTSSGAASSSTSALPATSYNEQSGWYSRPGSTTDKGTGKGWQNYSAPPPYNQPEAWWEETQAEAWWREPQNDTWWQTTDPQTWTNAQWRSNEDWSRR